MDDPRDDDPPEPDPRLALPAPLEPLHPAVVLASRLGLALLGSATAVVVVLGW